MAGFCPLLFGVGQLGRSDGLSYWERCEVDSLASRLLGVLSAVGASGGDWSFPSVGALAGDLDRLGVHHFFCSLDFLCLGHVFVVSFFVGIQGLWWRVRLPVFVV